MTSQISRKTIKEVCNFEGIGLHQGGINKIICRPAKSGEGINFHQGGNSLRVTTNKVLSTRRGTTVENEKFKVHTIEHLFSALHALGISDLHLDIEGNEIPIYDGSARPFFDSFCEVGLVDFAEKIDCIVVKEKLEFEDELTGSKFVIEPFDGLAVEASLDYDDPVIGQQTAQLNSLAEFDTKICGSRTFVLASELRALYEANLIKGGRPDNALVFKDSKITDDEVESLKTLIGIDVELNKDSDVINNLSLHFDNEPARHKLLDLLGDLYLIGLPIKGKIKAYKPGHTANFRFAKFLKDYHLGSKTKKTNIMFDPTAPAIKDVTAIQELLPHRYPFLFVDKIIEMSENHVVGVKNVTINENYFQGHFPNNPVFPGVLQMEALAQCGGILALSLSEEGSWDTYFVKMDKVKFRKMVYPGDALVLHMELMAPIRRGLVKMYGKAYVKDVLVSEGELIAKIVKREE